MLSPLWGSILDRTGHGNRILLISFIAQAIGFSVFPFLSNPSEYILDVALIGLFSSSFIPVYAALATIANPRHGRAIGRFWIAASIGYASVTIIGGLLYQYESIDYLFVLGAIYGFLGALIICLAPRDALTIKRSVERRSGFWHF